MGWGRFWMWWGGGAFLPRLLTAFLEVFLFYSSTMASFFPFFFAVQPFSCHSAHFLTIISLTVLVFTQIKIRHSNRSAAIRYPAMATDGEQYSPKNPGRGHVRPLATVVFHNSTAAMFSSRWSMLCLFPWAFSTFMNLVFIFCRCSVFRTRAFMSSPPAEEL